MISNRNLMIVHTYLATLWCDHFNWANWFGRVTWLIDRRVNHGRIVQFGITRFDNFRHGWFFSLRHDLVSLWVNIHYIKTTDPVIVDIVYHILHLWSKIPFLTWCFLCCIAKGREINGIIGSGLSIKIRLDNFQAWSRVNIGFRWNVRMDMCFYVAPKMSVVRHREEIMILIRTFFLWHVFTWGWDNYCLFWCSCILTTLMTILRNLKKSSITLEL